MTRKVFLGLVEVGGGPVKLKKKTHPLPSPQHPPPLWSFQGTNSLAKSLQQSCCSCCRQTLPGSLSTPLPPKEACKTCPNAKGAEALTSLLGWGGRTPSPLKEACKKLFRSHLGWAHGSRRVRLRQLPSKWTGGQAWAMGASGNGSGDQVREGPYLVQLSSRSIRTWQAPILLQGSQVQTRVWVWVQQSGQNQFWHRAPPLVYIHPPFATPSIYADIGSQADLSSWNGIFLLFWLPPDNEMCSVRQLVF